jgi:hypothetical protein
MQHVAPHFEHKEKTTPPISSEKGTFIIQPSGNTECCSAAFNYVTCMCSNLTSNLMEQICNNTEASSTRMVHPL